MANNVNFEQLQGLGLAPKKEPVKKEELGQDDFLELMTAQLRNQDPLKPMDNGEFLGQIAQFASVKGIQSLQSTFKQFTDYIAGNQALQAASLVGKSVLVDGDVGVLFPGDGMEVAVDLSTGVDQLRLDITDSSGQLMRQLDLGPRKAGRVMIGWNGQNQQGQQLPVGPYAIKATARVANKEVPVKTLVAAPIDSVDIDKAKSDVSLNLRGLGPRSLTDVRVIQ